MEDLIKHYVDAGVNRDKIRAITHKQGGVVTWSNTWQCLVDDTYSKDCVDDSMVQLDMYNGIDEELLYRINNSSGIILTSAVYGKPYYRFGFVPEFI